ncbi:MAG: nucleotidyltransferase domain-containing protein [Clostridia bacterium]|nr:nucleotidyltransferase domain-containing protein [Clostridia bacterium]
MFNPDAYLQQLTDRMKAEFGSRLLYVGLQGSYLRGEATENSDLDVMVIIDRLSAADLAAYRNIISGMEAVEKSCGFICGREEFAAWNPLEACHVLHGTKDYYGTLAPLIPQYEKQDILHFVKLSLGNLYHEICHRYIHMDTETNRQALPMTYKGVFFILQNLYYLKTGAFCLTKKELLGMLEKDDRAVMEMSLRIASDPDYDFDQAFETLFAWCQRTLTCCENLM